MSHDTSKRTIVSSARKNLKPNEQPMAENRQVVLMRNVRHRMQGNANHANHLREANDDRQINQNYEEDKDDKIDHKIGTKKRIKLAAKAEKKVQREAAEREREERKKREQLLQEERDKQAEKEYVEQLRVEETEKKAREEKEKQEYEEYLKMKEAFSVEEEGYEQENNECENLLQEFLAYIKLNKVLILEDLAAHFGLKTASVVERIQELQANGNLTGVIDDRGKFIYISEDELQAVAKFVRQRGRVSIAELAENSNNLINLTPAKSCSVFVR
ncbi:DDRGK domain-containing protein 1 [Cyphomyrmex costatus]|uniref:DDRGK domain-containing protein 1 n=1 Tax=Cyphomyrmex costatus TaxID=456900 RepID=A0A151IG70_9HYME|nr:DDRGK domain-containing protein 1 [Cyphomyrmex costatus]